jgi:acetolactate synthase I/II/III large subunit
LVALIWEVAGYRSVGWKMDPELGDHYCVGSLVPTRFRYAECIGTTGYIVSPADESLPILRRLVSDGVSVTGCSFECSEPFGTLGNSTASSSRIAVTVHLP